MRLLSISGFIEGLYPGLMLLVVVAGADDNSDLARIFSTSLRDSSITWNDVMMPQRSLS